MGYKTGQDIAARKRRKQRISILRKDLASACVRGLGTSQVFSYYDRKYTFLIVIVYSALWEKCMKHEGREEVQRNEGIYIFRVLHILQVFVFKMLFLKTC